MCISKQSSILQIPPLLIKVTSPTFNSWIDSNVNGFQNNENEMFKMIRKCSPVCSSSEMFLLIKRVIYHTMIFQSLLICRICGFYRLAACFHLSAKGANERWPTLSHIKWTDLNFSHMKINCMTFVLA